MQKLLLAQKEQILHMNCKIEADQKEQSLAEIAFRQSDIYCKFKDAANDNKPIDAQDWEMLRIKVDRCYKDFTARLQAIYPVSDIEMKICLLLKIGINVTGIAQLTRRTKSAIVSARKSCMKRHTGKLANRNNGTKLFSRYRCLYKKVQLYTQKSHKIARQNKNRTKTAQFLNEKQIEIP